MLLRDHMVDLVDGKREFLGKATVLATPLGSLLHESPKLSGHASGTHGGGS
jgi:hypothetical protein